MKTEAIIKMTAPQNTPELRRFTGMVNQLSKFIPNCADYLHPLNALLNKKNAGCGDQPKRRLLTQSKRNYHI